MLFACAAGPMAPACSASSQRLEAERAGALGVAAPPGDPAAVRLDDGLVGAEAERLDVVALGQLPVAAALVDDAELVLDAARARRLALRRGRVVGGERGAVGALQRSHVADRLVQRLGIGVAERERGLVVRDRLGARREHPGAIAGGGVLLGRLPVVPGALEMVRDDRRIRAQRLERLGDAAVQQPSPGQADAVLGDRPQPLVAEVVGVVALGDQPACRQLLERARDLVVGAAADDAQRLGVEPAADERRRAEHLRRRLADRGQARLEHGAHAPGRAAAGRQELRDEQRQPLALAVHLAAGRLVEARAGASPSTSSRVSRPSPMLCPSSASRAPRWSGSGSSVRRAASSRTRRCKQAPAEVAERIERRRIAPVEIVDEHHAGRVAERVADQPADRLEEVLARPRLVEAGRRSRPEIGQQPRRVAAQRLRQRAPGRSRRRRAAAARRRRTRGLARRRAGAAVEHASAASRQRRDRLLARGASCRRPTPPRSRRPRRRRRSRRRRRRSGAARPRGRRAAARRPAAPARRPRARARSRR